CLLTPSLDGRLRGLLRKPQIYPLFESLIFVALA
ncbi:MAG: hypothetical protein RL351_984, partial [Actinomycetota bacterium]